MNFMIIVDKFSRPSYIKSSKWANVVVIFVIAHSCIHWNKKIEESPLLRPPVFYNVSLIAIVFWMGTYE